MQLGDINPELFNALQGAVVHNMFLRFAKVRNQLSNSLVSVVCHDAVLLFNQVPLEL